jgi:excisionase family DNA binding protein
MTITDVMKYLKVSRTSVYRMMYAGKLTPVRLGKKTIRFKRSDIDQLIGNS